MTWIGQYNRYVIELWNGRFFTRLDHFRCCGNLDIWKAKFMTHKQAVAMKARIIKKFIYDDSDIVIREVNVDVVGVDISAMIYNVN